MENILDKKNEVDAACEMILKISKIIGFVGSICGFFYLIAYTHNVGIPFPVELSVLPTMLLLVGIASLGSVIILAGGVVIPAIIADDPLGVTKKYFLARDVPNKIPVARIRRYAMCLLIPMIIALLALLLQMEIFGENSWNMLGTIVLFFLSFVWIIATPFFIPAFKNKYRAYYFTIFTQTFFSLFGYCIFILLAVLTFPEMEDWPAWQGCLVALVVFSFIHLMITLPSDKSVTGSILGGDSLPVSMNYEARSSAAAILLIVIIAVAFSVFSSPLNARIGRAVLYNFGIGGGLPAIICLKTPAPPPVLHRIKFLEGNCSEPIQILFDGGDKVYVAKIPKEDISMGKKRWAEFEPVYFRQDEIGQKIHLSQVNKKTDSAAAEKISAP
ncbi:hypothetical protein [Janthinobacterium rivuli]|uniref:hypothetical protein n=1 Tax=Janthinobacterium rivuli TaxID=2751478 RepID=UPI00383A8ECD